MDQAGAFLSVPALAFADASAASVPVASSRCQSPAVSASLVNGPVGTEEFVE